MPTTRWLAAAPEDIDGYDFGDQRNTYPARSMAATTAKALFDKLSPFLRVKGGRTQWDPNQANPRFDMGFEDFCYRFGIELVFDEEVVNE